MKNDTYGFEIMILAQVGSVSKFEESMRVPLLVVVIVQLVAEGLEHKEGARTAEAAPAAEAAPGPVHV